MNICLHHLFTHYMLHEHVNLTPYSAMSARLAAQVLSTIVSKVSFNCGAAGATTTGQHRHVN